MKAIKKIQLMILGLALMIQYASAQNYKAPAIDASGKFTDRHGKNIGMISSQGAVDSRGVKMAHIDSEGNLVDSKSGKKMGKAEKNGDFTYHFAETGESKKFTVGPPSQGICEVKDDKGKVVLLVHENYKAQAPCAFHCLQLQKEGEDMKMKK